MRPQNDPKNAVAVSGDDSTGDGGTGWVGGCAATIAVVAVMILGVIAWIA